MRATDETGSAVAEFVLVSILLTVLTLGVLQLALALLVRNTLVDAAAEGARFASLADASPADGVRRTRELIATAIGPAYAGDVTIARTDYRGHPAFEVTVRAPLPVIGLLGVADSLEVAGHAAIETVG
jgi:Flp pilus assembly protein TadG